MTTQKIKENLEKLRALVSLYNNLCESAKNTAEKEDFETLMLKITTSKEEMLKINYKVGHALKELEEKV